MKLKRLHRYLLPLAALSLLPTVASAFDYSYLEGGYLHRDNDQVDESGFRLAGSVNVLPNVAVIAGYGDTGNYDRINAGALFHTPLNSTLDLVAGATLEHANSHHDDDTGIGLRGGVRWQLLPDLELNPELRYVDVFGGMTSARVGALYRINPALFVQGAVQAGDEDQVEVGLRYAF